MNSSLNQISQPQAANSLATLLIILRSSKALILAFLLTLNLGWVNVSAAQDANLTPEQLIQLQSLPPAQRQSLLDSPGGSGSQPAAQAQLSQPVEVMPRVAPAEENQ